MAESLNVKSSRVRINIGHYLRFITIVVMLPIQLLHLYDFNYDVCIYYCCTLPGAVCLHSGIPRGFTMFTLYFGTTDASSCNVYVMTYSLRSRDLFLVSHWLNWKFGH